MNRRAHHDRLGPRLYPCTICGEVFYKSTKLKYHREVHLKTLRENPTKERDRLAIERGEPNIYYCDKCPKTWNTKSEIAKHMVDSHVLDQFVCSNCGKVFNTTKKHRDHVRKVHDNKNREPQLCTLCGKTFGDTPSLRVNI